MGGIVDAVFGGGGGSSSTTSPGPMSEEEKALIKLQTQLSQKQLDAISQLQPYQQQLLNYSTKQLSSQQAYQDALDAAISPADQAAAQKAQFDQAAALGPIQTEMAQMQLAALKQGGRATDQQKSDIASATDAALQSGYGDIDTNTRRGIGMISDELANSRGLRLSDSPITSEAALLARAGMDQKSSLTNNLRAGQASAVLNYPLAVQQLQSGINLGQQGVNSSFQSFQDQLRQQAYQNRVSLTGPALTGGLGLSGIGGGSGALSALNGSRGSTTSGNSSPSGAQTLSSIGSLASGIGALAVFSDPRLKDDYGVVGETSEGLGLHLYHYKGESKDAPVRMGVMADEVKKIKPHLVHRHPSGYDMVDYAGIGLAT